MLFAVISSHRAAQGRRSRGICSECIVSGPLQREGGTADRAEVRKLGWSRRTK